jgi:hypothetical protein
MRQIIIDKLYKLKNDEESFLSSYWKNIYFADLKNNVDHISFIKFENLVNEDLVRCFQYLILTRDNISRNRVNNMYFKK